MRLPRTRAGRVLYAQQRERFRRATERARQAGLASGRSAEGNAASLERPAASLHDLLASDLMGAARQHALPAIVTVRRGTLVVHRLLGVGQVIGYDPPGVPDRMVRVRFRSGLALVDLSELSEPVLLSEMKAGH